MTASIYSISGPEERLRAERAAYATCRIKKVAKVFVTDNDTVLVSMDSFHDQPHHFTAIFENSLKILSFAVDHFLKGMETGDQEVEPPEKEDETE